MNSKTQRIAHLPPENPQETLQQELKRYADDANQRHELATAAYGDALNHAYRAGRALRSAKLIVGHGGWKNWVKKNFKGSLRIAQAYMRIAKRWRDLKKWESVHPDLKITLSDALNLLTKNTTGRKKPFDRDDINRSHAFKGFLQSLYGPWDKDDIKTLRNSLGMDPDLQEMVKQAMEQARLKIRKQQGRLTDEERKELNRSQYSHKLYRAYLRGFDAGYKAATFTDEDLAYELCEMDFVTDESKPPPKKAVRQRAGTRSSNSRRYSVHLN